MYLPSIDSRVSDADVAGSLNGEYFAFSHQESGNYEATLSMEGLGAGTHGIYVGVEKEGDPRARLVLILNTLKCKLFNKV